MKRYLLSYFTLFLGVGLSFQTLAQTGGQHVYEFISLPVSARSTGLGDVIIAANDDYLAAALENPASLSSENVQDIVVSHDFYLSSVTRGLIDYGFKLNSFTAHVGLQYINYGSFDQTNNLGIIEGDFSASELALNFGVSRDLSTKIRLGANMKLVHSSLESYTSTGLLADVGVMFHNDEKNLNCAIVVKNIGAQLSTYAGESEAVPFDLQIGVSKRLEHVPFRFGITAHHLHTWDIAYDNPDDRDDNSGPFVDNTSDNTGSFSDNLFRHLIFQGEIFIGKKDNFQVRFGYNHLRGKEQALQDFRNLAGFSVGFGLKFNKFQLDYGLGKHNVAATAHHLTLSTNLKNFGKEKI